MWQGLTLAISSGLASAAIFPSSQPDGLKMDFELLHGGSLDHASAHHSPGRSKREDTLLELTNQEIFYKTPLYVGAQRDKVWVLIDTVSSETWVMGRDAVCEEVLESHFLTENTTTTSRLGPATKLPGTSPNQTVSDAIATEDPRSEVVKSRNGVHVEECKVLGSFSTAQSKSFRKEHGADFFLIFDEGTYVRGIWGTDTIEFSSQAVNLTFGVANRTLCKEGSLGLGILDFFTLEHVANSQTNFPVQLKRSGMIKKIVYSLHLKGRTAEKGTIRFGAVDHGKYSGKLQTVPIVSIYKNSSARHIPAVTLSGMYLESNHQNITILNQPIGALLNSGYSFHVFPPNVLLGLARLLLANYSESGNFYEVDCALITDPTALVYDFSGIKIKVPVKDLLVRHDSVCYLAAESYDDESLYAYAALGLSFLRSAYIVYDLEALEVSMAQVKDSQAENIEVVTSTVPGAVKAPRYYSTRLATSISEPTAVRFQPPSTSNF